MEDLGGREGKGGGGGNGMDDERTARKCGNNSSSTCLIPSKLIPFKFIENINKHFRRGFRSIDIQTSEIVNVTE